MEGDEKCVEIKILNEPGCQKLSGHIEEVAGEDVKEEVLRGSEELTDQSSVREVVGWTQGAMDRLVMLVGEGKSKEIITRCAWHYSNSSLKEVRRKYEETGDIDLVLRRLQEKFESFLENTLGLSKELIADVVGRFWRLCLVGVRSVRSPFICR